MCEEDSAKGEAKVGEKLKTYCCDASNMEAFSFLENKSCNKQACDQMTVIYISATRHVPSAIVIFITESMMARSLLSAKIKDAHTQLISPGHLYNNTFAQSQ